MRQILLEWGSIRIWSYPAFFYLGLVTGVFVENLAAHVTGVNAYRVFVATLILIPPAIAGSRLLYVAANWKQYRAHPGRIWNLQEGGLAMYGGLPVMLLLSLPVLAVFKLGVGEFWDVATFTILTGLSITKIGCLLNGCCAGRPSDVFFAVALRNSRGERVKRIPVQCIEAAWGLIVLSCAGALLGHLPFKGAVFLLVTALYGAGRLGLETLREPEPNMTRICDVFSVMTVISAAGTLIAQWPR